MTKPPIYLDHNATTPISPAVAEAMKPFLFGLFGNPSSEHPYGSEAKRSLELARGQVAGLIGASPFEIIFTSGGTEANNLALKGVASLRGTTRNHVVCSAVEHPAVLEVVYQLGRQGFRVSVLPVDENGRVRLEDVEEAVDDETLIVSVMLANNEVGTLQPIAEIAKIAHARGALVHTDAAQAIGKVATNVHDLGVDLLSIAGHKCYAPKGVGALFVRNEVKIEQQMHGAGHERGLRPGTENVMLAAGLGRACAEAERIVSSEMPRIAGLREAFEQKVLDSLGANVVRINAQNAPRLPNTSSVSFRGVPANTLLAEIGESVAASAGAACHADEVDVSSVLEAMGVAEEWAMGTVRFSLGIGNSAEDVDAAAMIVCRAVDGLVGGAENKEYAPNETSGYRLTRYTQGMGCACKIRPQMLEKILADLPSRIDENVMVDMSTSDDAAVYRLSDDVALVQTADFFTPIVDDPFTFGAIAAANAISDIYAMGAQPLYAVNIVGFPTKRLPMRVLREILLGAADKCAEAGINIVGGHTVEDAEPKFGLAVTGQVHPSQILRNSTARVGDALILTKPLGSGIIATALKRGMADSEQSLEMIAVMSELNMRAARAMKGIEVSACTDVTGFGLLGHLYEMTSASGVRVEISAGRVPVMDEARRLSIAGVVPGGTLDNLQYVSPHVTFVNTITDPEKWILADAQTSGGLLISVPGRHAEELLGRLAGDRSSWVSKIGHVTDRGDGDIHVVE